MKEVFEKNDKLYLFSLVLFLITSIIFKIIPSDVVNVLTYIIFPIYFFVLVFFHSKNNKINWNVPIILTIIYTLVGYTCMGGNISAKKIVVAYIFGLIPLIIKLFTDKKKKNKKEKVEEFSEHEKRIISYAMPAITMIVLEWYYTVCTFNTLTINIEPKAMIIGLILTYSIYLILLSIFRRSSIANKTYAILFFVIFIINELRI